jgi:hypothetical protein
MTVFFLTLVMLAAVNGIGGLDGFIPFTIASLVSVVIGLGLSTAMPFLLSRDRDQAVASRVALAMLLLAWGPFFSFHLKNIPGLATLQLGLGESGWVRFLHLEEISFLPVVQIIIIVFSGLLSAFTLWRIRVHLVKQGSRPLRWGWIMIFALCVVYSLVAFVLIFSGLFSS